MQLKITSLCNVSKKMGTERPTGGGDESDIVTCSVTVKVRVQRDTVDELAGIPIGSTQHLYDDLGVPYQHTQMQFPKRVLLASGWIEHRRDSGAAMARLEIKMAAAGALKFKLDTPDDQGPTALAQFALVWKATGDEGEDVKAILGRKCWMEITFADQPQQPLFRGSVRSPKAEAQAAAKEKLDRKRQAAGEKPTDNDPVPPAEVVQVPPPSNVVDLHGKGATKKRKTSNLTELEREAADIAKKHPRRDPPKPRPPTDKRKH